MYHKEAGSGGGMAPPLWLQTKYVYVKCFLKFLFWDEVSHPKFWQGGRKDMKRDQK